MSIALLATRMFIFRISRAILRSSVEFDEPNHWMSWGKCISIEYVLYYSSWVCHSLARATQRRHSCKMKPAPPTYTPSASPATVVETTGEMAPQPKPASSAAWAGNCPQATRPNSIPCTLDPPPVTSRPRNNRVLPPVVVWNPLPPPGLRHPPPPARCPRRPNLTIRNT